MQNSRRKVNLAFRDSHEERDRNSKVDEWWKKTGVRKNYGVKKIIGGPGPAHTAVARIPHMKAPRSHNFSWQ